MMGFRGYSSIVSSKGRFRGKTDTGTDTEADRLTSPCNAAVERRRYICTIVKMSPFFKVALDE